MNIGIDARMYGIKQRGLGRYVERLVKNLLELKSGHRFTLFALPEELAAFADIRGQVSIVSAPAKWYTAKEQIMMPGLVKRSGVDLMHWTHFNAPILGRVPYVATIHDLIMLNFPAERATTRPLWQYRLKLKVHNFVLKRCVKRAARVITVSEFTKKDIMRRLHIPARAIAVTRLGVDQFILGTGTMSNSPQFTEYLQKKFNLKKRYIIYAGSAYPHKNLETLVSAFSILRCKYGRDWQLVLIGKKDFFYERLSKFVAQNKEVAKNVVFCGEVSDKELDGLYRDARLFAMPSLYEGFGLPPIEAMARGVPVAASRVSSLPEVLADAALYFDPESARAMASALDQLGGNRALREELAAKGLERAKLFSWRRTAEETLAVYEEVMGNL